MILSLQGLVCFHFSLSQSQSKFEHHVLLGLFITRSSLSLTTSLTGRVSFPLLHSLQSLVCFHYPKCDHYTTVTVFVTGPLSPRHVPLQEKCASLSFSACLIGRTDPSQPAVARHGLWLLLQLRYASDALAKRFEDRQHSSLCQKRDRAEATAGILTGVAAMAGSILAAICTVRATRHDIRIGISRFLWHSSSNSHSAIPSRVSMISVSQTLTNKLASLLLVLPSPVLPPD